MDVSDPFGKDERALTESLPLRVQKMIEDRFEKGESLDIDYRNYFSPGQERKIRAEAYIATFDQLNDLTTRILDSESIILKNAATIVRDTILDMYMKESAKKKTTPITTPSLFSPNAKCGERDFSGAANSFVGDLTEIVDELDKVFVKCSRLATFSGDPKFWRAKLCPVC